MTNEELAVLIQQGHTELYTELWERVSRLINMMIGKYAERRILPPDIEKEDLLQCGYFAMLAAVKSKQQKSFQYCPLGRTAAISSLGQFLFYR